MTLHGCVNSVCERRPNKQTRSHENSIPVRPSTAHTWIAPAEHRKRLSYPSNGRQKAMQLKVRASYLLPVQVNADNPSWIIMCLRTDRAHFL